MLYSIYIKQEVLRMLEVNLEVKDNSQAVIKAKATKKAKKPLKTMKEAWTTIMQSASVRNSAKDKARMIKLYELMKDGTCVREADKMNKNFTFAEAKRIITAHEERERLEYLESLKHLQEDYYVMVTDPADIPELMESIRNRKRVYMGVDTETTGTDPYTDKIVGYSFTWAVKDYTSALAPDDCLRNIYVPIAHENAVNMPYNEAMALYKWVVEEECMETVWYNFPFDYHIGNTNAGIKVKGMPVDCFPLMRMLNENMPEERRPDGTKWSFKLKDVVTRYLKIPSQTYGALFGKAPFSEVDVDIARWYASKDTHVTYLLKEWQYAMLEKPQFAGIKKHWLEVELPVTRIFVEMESQGFNLVESAQKEQAEKAIRILGELEGKLKEVFGEINFGSPAQLKQAFIEQGYSKYLDKGANMVTDKAMLGKLAKVEPIVAVLQDYRKLAKQYSGFIDSLPKHVKPDGKIHGTFNQIGTKTLRVSAEKPNLQQQSNGFEVQDEFFSSRDMLSVGEGSLILSADFGRQEITWQAEYSRDETLVNLLNGTQDIYGFIASKVWNQPYEACIDSVVDGHLVKSPYRKKAKVLVLAISYEMSDMGLAPMLGLVDGNVPRWIALDKTGKHAFTSESEETVKTWIEQGKELEPDVNYELVQKDIFLTGEAQAQEIIDYLDVLFPKLRKWKNGVKKVAHEQFYVDARFGARRRFTVPTEGKYGEKGYIKGDYYTNWQGKKTLKAGCERQAINFHIQYSASVQTKCAMIALQNFFETIRTPERWFALLAPVHDELLMIVPTDVTTSELEMVQHLMINSAPIIACGRTDLALGKCWGDMDEIEKTHPDFLKRDGIIVSDPAKAKWVDVYEGLKQDIAKFKNNA